MPAKERKWRRGMGYTGGCLEGRRRALGDKSLFSNLIITLQEKRRREEEKKRREEERRGEERREGPRRGEENH